MNAADLRNMPSEELNAQVIKDRESLFKFRFQASREEMQRAGEIRALRKNIARCKTVLSERDNAAKNGSAKETANVDG